MVDQFRQEHATLIAFAERLIAHLRRMPSALLPVGDVEYAEHHDFTERVLSLSLYLAAALQAASSALYPAAFAGLRSAMEHQLMDRLIFRADRYVRRLSNIPKRQWEELEARKGAGDAGTEDILALEWRERGRPDIGELTIVRSGVHPSGEARTGSRTLSYMYYVLYLEDYDPFRGPPDDQAFLQPGFVDREARERWAERNRRIYRETKWESLKNNLRLNGLSSESDFITLDVHYRFLSAFTHPTPAAHTLVYGRNRPSGAPKYDHFASELCLLYAIRFATAELRDFRAMTQNEPQVDVSEWTDTEAEIATAESLTAYLWFVGDEPNELDRFDEANARAYEAQTWKTRERPTPPAEIPADGVRYYGNPLERIRRLHRVMNEGTTGFGYASPWPRADAGW